MPFWPKDKKGKDDKTTSAKRMTVSKSDGDIVHNSTTTFIRQQSSISQTTEIRTTTVQTFRGTSPCSSQASINSLTERNRNADGSNTSLQRYGNIKDSLPSFISPLNKSKINIDALPFPPKVYKSSPARSAFTSPPLTTTAKLPINLNYKSPYTSADARRGSGGNITVPARSQRPSLPIITQKATPTNFNAPPPIPSYQSNDEEFRGKLTVKVEKSSKFYDDQNSKVPMYSTRSKYRGKLLIINNIKFAKEKKIRKGAELDEENLVQLFKQMKFAFIQSRDLTKEQMKKKITTFSSDSSLKKYDIVTVIIMSHGTGKERSDSTEILCTDGELLQTTWILSQFDGELCPHLNGKPKIFIFQCCRGDNRDVEPDAVGFSPRKLSDMLIAYSTIPGFVSHRDTTTGSWYIQAICRVFMEHAHDTDVENLLKIVDNKLALVVSSSKQTSSFENRGFKTCYLHPQLNE